jgi:Flp pilus assembly protein TadD
MSMAGVRPAPTRARDDKRRSRGRHPYAAAIALLVACAHGSAAPRVPAAAVRAEIAQAETAEKGRRHDVARSHYQRAIAEAHDPVSIAFARHEYAETLVTWGETPEAHAQLEIAATANPDDPSIWHDLGVLRHHAGDDPGAIQALVRAERLAPGDPRPRTALAALYWKRGDKPHALTEYRGLLELDLPERMRAKVEWAIGELAKP